MATDSSAAARHPTHDEACAVCAENSGERHMRHGVLFADDDWVLRHAEPPYGVAGWVTLQARRHVSGPADFSDVEAARLGPCLRHLCRLLKAATGAPKVYVAALGESYPHFHCHLVPRADAGAATVKGWALFSQAAEAAAGRVSVDEAAVAAIVEQLRAALAAEPLPGAVPLPDSE